MMKATRGLSLKQKLLGSFILAALIPLVLIGCIGLDRAHDSMQRLALNQLRSIQQVKRGQVTTFFAERLGDVEVLAANPYTHRALLELDKANMAAKEKGLIGTGMLQDPAYRKAYDFYHSTFKHYMETCGYFDVFLICPEHGDVFYTVSRQADFGTELSHENTGLALVWRQALRTGRPALSDMAPYAPSAGAPAMFMACPVVELGETIGVVALQISTDAIDHIMQERSGLGETGETYLVGSDKRMRSDSFLDPTGHSLLASFKGTVRANGVDTEAARLALSGQSGSGIITHYNGNQVLSAYSPLDLPGGLRWAILAEIDLGGDRSAHQRAAHRHGDHRRGHHRGGRTAGLLAVYWHQWQRGDSPVADREYHQQHLGSDVRDG